MGFNTGCVAGLSPNVQSTRCCRRLLCFGRSFRAKSAERCKVRHAMCSDNIGIGGDSAIFSLVCFPHEGSSHNNKNNSDSAGPAVFSGVFSAETRQEERDW